MRKQSTAPQFPISQRTACPDASGTMLCMPATPGSAVFKRVLGAQRTKDGFVSQRRGAQVALAEPPAAICRIGGQCAGERKSEAVATVNVHGGFDLGSLNAALKQRLRFRWAQSPFAGLLGTRVQVAFYQLLILTVTVAGGLALLDSQPFHSFVWA